MARTLINSDDFGYSVQVNEAIALAFKQGLLDTTTTLVNFEAGFEDAKIRLRSKQLQPETVGIHLNLSEGKPLTEKIKTLARFCENGLFHARLRDRPIFFLNTDETSAVKAELKAQIEKFAEFGFYPHHIDSHHHVHTEWALLKITIELAHEYQIKRIRPTRNIGKIGLLKRIYKACFNLRLSLSGLKQTKYFGDLDDVIYSKTTQNIEVMVHALLDGSALTDLDGKRLDVKIRQAFPNRVIG